MFSVRLGHPSYPICALVEGHVTAHEAEPEQLDISDRASQFYEFRVLPKDTDLTTTGRAPVAFDLPVSVRSLERSRSLDRSNGLLP